MSRLRNSASTENAAAGLAIFGVTGRMGQSLLRALREPAAQLGEPLALSGALASATSARLGSDAALGIEPSGVRVTADPGEALTGAAVAVDFSLPGAVAAHARACRARRVPLLIGATGYDPSAHACLEAAAAEIPVLIAPNTSLGVAVLTHLVAIAVRALGEDYEVEIGEVHHRSKRDAPSGTALSLGEAVARARGVDLKRVAVYDRHGVGVVRDPGSIGFSAVRAGDIVGEHTVLLATDGERLELAHRAGDRMLFARGALKAARWLIGRPPGLYGMADVLGLPRA